MKPETAITLAELEAFDPRAARGGNERRCRCPVCQAKEASFCFNATTGLYNCKRASCGAKGRLRDFWVEKPPQSPRIRAKKALDAAFSVDRPSDVAKVSPPATEATWGELWESAAAVGQGSSGLAYLEGRGLTAEIIAASGARSLHLHHRDWVAFPFTGQQGEIVAFQARAIDQELNGHRAYGPKKAGVFLTSPETLKAQTVFVTEAPIDALSLAMCGRHAVALGGVVMPDWLIKLLAFRTIALAFDNDSNGAGRKAAQELQPKLLSFGIAAFRMKPQREKDEEKGDWNMMLKTLGPGRLTQWLNYYESKAVVKLGKTWKRPGGQ